MDVETKYLNTDLVLISTKDIIPLLKLFKKKNCIVLSSTLEDDGKHYSYVESRHSQNKTPEKDIDCLLKVIELFKEDKELWKLWGTCEVKKFDMGFDGGLKPWSFMQPLSSEVIQRLARVKASLGITLYPCYDLLEKKKKEKTK